MKNSRHNDFHNWLLTIEGCIDYSKNIKRKMFGESNISSYMKHLTFAISDLGISTKDFAKCSQIGLLKPLLKSLEKSVSFQNRSFLIQMNITSAFNVYMMYVIDTSK